MSGWVLWLVAPAAATVLACLAAWWAGRPRRLPGTARAVRDHDRFLRSLDELAGQPPRGG